MVSLEQALAIIRPLERDFPFSLPPGVQSWLQEKLSKYCQEDKGKVLSKGTFVQVCNGAVFFRGLGECTPDRMCK